MNKKVKLFIQIPCYNEENTLAYVISDLPRHIDGVAEIYTLVIDDGSSDNTIERAKELGIDYIQTNHYNQGLAKSFANGIETCLLLGADIIVNTDGDNQYNGEDIAKIVKPILDRKKDVVIGCRDIKSHDEFSFFKKFFQIIGSKVVSLVSRIEIPDATSGFRSFSRTAALRVSVMSKFSYTLEILIQAGLNNFEVGYVMIRTNKKMRESRLFKSIFHFIFKQVGTIFSVYLFYSPQKIFAYLAGICFFISAILLGRILFYLVDPDIINKFKTGSGLFFAVFFLSGVISVITSLITLFLSKLRIQIDNQTFLMKKVFYNSKFIPEYLNILRSSELGKWKVNGKSTGTNKYWSISFENS